MFSKKIFPFILVGMFSFMTAACDDSQEIEEENENNENQQGQGDGNEQAKYMVGVYTNETLVKDVDAAALTPKEVTINDEKMNVVPVSDIIAKANNITNDDELDAFLAKYLCDYEGEGGFRPSSKGDRCPPLSCSLSKMSYVSTTSERLIHDEEATELQIGCYSVRGIHKVLLIDAESDNTGNNDNTGNGDNTGNDQETFESRYVAVYVDGTKVGDVDLATLVAKAFKDANGHTVVHISDVIAAADSTIDLSTTFCDYASEYGTDNEWRPSKKSACSEVRACSYATDAVVALSDSYLTADAAAAGCYSVKNLDTILISTEDPNNASAE